MENKRLNLQSNPSNKLERSIAVAFYYYISIAFVVLLFILLQIILSEFKSLHPLGNTIDAIMRQNSIQLLAGLLFCLSQVAYLFLFVMLIKLRLQKRMTKKLRAYWYFVSLFLLPELYLAAVFSILLIGGFDLQF